jgi:uncharacterized protein (TIGR02246 family)
MRKICALVSISATMCVAATYGTPKDESEIRQVLADVAVAFNQHKANLIPEATAEAFDVVNPDGTYTTGIPDLRDAFSGAFRNARMVATVDRIRFIRPDVSLVDGTFEVTGTEITPAPKGRRTFVLVKENGRWMITALRQMIPVVPAGATSPKR